MKTLESCDVCACGSIVCICGRMPGPARCLCNSVESCRTLSVEGLVSCGSVPLPSRAVPRSCLGVVCLSQAWRCCAAARRSVASQSCPILDPTHAIPTIPYHTTPYRQVWKGAAAWLGQGTYLSGCASPCPGVAILRHSSGAHNTSHPISSRHVQSHPVRSPSHPIPSHPISSHLVWKGAAARHGWGTHVSGCASPLPGVAILRHSSGAAQYIPSHLIPSRPIPSRQVTIPSHPIPSHPI